MGVLILQHIFSIVLGQCFDLVQYQFTPVNPYAYIKIDDHIQTTEVNTFSSEFQIVSSRYDVARFFGMDDISYLKNERQAWSFSPDNELLNLPHPDHINIAVRIIKRTMKETIPVETPFNRTTESKVKKFGGTHYLKSITYGIELRALIHIYRRQNNLEDLKRLVETEIGSKGNFDADFVEKVSKITTEANTKYMVEYCSTIGIEFCSKGFRFEHILDIRHRMQSGGIHIYAKIPSLSEFHSLSEISPSFPLVEAKKEFVEKAEQLRSIYNEVKNAQNHIKRLLYFYGGDLTPEQKRESEKMLAEVRSLKDDIDRLISNIDVTTGGDAHQFDEVFQKYNSTNVNQYLNRVWELQSYHG